MQLEVHAREHVLERGHVLEQPDVLERSPNPGADDVVWSRVAEDATEKPHDKASYYGRRAIAIDTMIVVTSSARRAQTAW